MCNSNPKRIFQLGANAFWLKPGEESEKQSILKARFEEVFSFATLPFNWGRYEAECGNPQQRRLLDMAAWFTERGIQVKGHPLCWHEVAPHWESSKTPNEMYRLQLERITREVTAFRGVVDMWDVLNEPVVMPRFTRTKSFLIDYVKEHGVTPLIQDVFARAREANPDAVLLINDYDPSEAYAEIIARCLDAGVEIDVIGIQSHMHAGYWGADRILEVCERFSRFGLPLHWTELTIPSAPEHPKNDWSSRQTDWDSTPEGEQLQLGQVSEIYTLLYQHPRVEAVTWWDLVDGGWLGAPAGLLRKDLSPKPAFHWLRELSERQPDC
ncbi:MAG: endo-1,4-beta-xylanase [Kiritimatiellia bacterium]